MDITWIATWFNAVTVFFQACWDFITNGIYTLLTDFLAVAVEAYVYSMVKFKLFCLKLAFDVVSEIATDTGAAALLQSAWGGLSGDVQSTLSFFSVPQGLTLILAAIPTKLVLRMLPGAGV